MRQIACLSRIALALLLTLSPIQWADARLCDMGPAAGPAASDATVHRADGARGGAEAVAWLAKDVAAGMSQRCCCDDGFCGAACAGCAHVLSAVNVRPPASTAPEQTFCDRLITAPFEFIAHPPTPPPLCA